MNEDHIPAELSALSDALDALAARERAAVPAGLPARVYRATIPALQGASLLGQEPAEVVYSFPAARKSGAGRGMAMAAGLALLATVGAVWVASLGRSGVVVASSDAELEAWIAMADGSDWNGLDAIDQLEADAEAVARAVRGSWMPEDIFIAEPISEDSL